MPLRFYIAFFFFFFRVKTVRPPDELTMVYKPERPRVNLPSLCPMRARTTRSFADGMEVQGRRL